MPIEVQCPRCAARLHVPDEAAGAQAKCPHCQEVFRVDGVEEATAVAPPTPPPVTPANDPYAGLAETTNPYADPPKSSQPDNPYAPPETDDTYEVATQLGRVDPGMALQLSWDLLKANLPILVTTHGAFLLIQLVFQLISSVAEQNGQPFAVMAIALGSTAAQWFLTIGLIIVTLQVARGQQPEFGVMFSGGPWFARVAVANLLFGLMVGLGFVLFIVPGIYLALRFWPFQYFIIDRDCSISESFSLAGQFTEGNKMSCFALGCIGVVVFLAGLLMLCVGLFFAYPVIMMMWTVAYLMMTRQPIQRPTA